MGRQVDSVRTAIARGAQKLDGGQQSARRLSSLADVHLVAHPREQRGGGESSNACAGDQYHGQRPLFEVSGQWWRV